MFQKIKSWFSKKTKRTLSVQNAINQLVQINNNNILSLYSYPKYEEETIVLIIKNEDKNIFTTLQTLEIKNILQKISFICLSEKEVKEATDV